MRFGGIVAAVGLAWTLLACWHAPAGLDSRVVTRTTLIGDLRESYERGAQSTLDGPPSSWRIFDDQREGAFSRLRGDALRAAREYADTLESGEAHGVGSVVVKEGTLDGQPMTFVAGDLGDTGTEIEFRDASGAVHRTVSMQRRYPRTEYGFYDASGRLLARAYRGQGEEPNARGVDWTE